jgi:hypothetical protein
MAGFGDETARFLTELRQLRDGAGLGHAELAAKAHYPYDSIRAAEVGPSLPDLPVLAAFVRGCGGTTEEWEERWRSLTRAPSVPLSTTRLAGNTAAAAAGARIGSTAMEGEVLDPSLILAALDRVADKMAAGHGEPAEALPLPEVSPASPPAGDLGIAGFDPSDLGTAGSGAGDLTTGHLTTGDLTTGDLAAGELAAGDFAAGDARVSAWDTPGASAGTDPDTGMPAGWDPIRVSTAWPVIPASLGDTDLADAVRAANGSGRANGTTPPREASPAAPWAVAPWATGDPAGTSGAGQPAAHRPATAPSGRAVPAPSLRADSDANAAGRASRARVLVVCAVLLCVIAVVLAVFV